MTGSGAWWSGYSSSGSDHLRRLTSCEQAVHQRLVVEERLHVVGLLDLAEAHLPGAGAHEDDAPLGGVETWYQCRSPSSTPVFSVYAATHVLLAHEVRHARHLEHRGQRLEDLVGEDHPRHVHLARAEGRHLPVEDGDGLEVAVDHVADPRVAPAEHGLVGVGQVGLEPGQRALDELRATAVGHRELVPLRGCGRGCAPARVSPGWSWSRNAKVVAASGIACSRPMTSTVASCRRRWSSTGGVVQPVVAEVVGHHVLRHHAVDAVHQEERRAEHVAGLLHPAHRRHRHVGELAGDPHGVVLVAQLVAREDRHVLLRRSDPGDVLPAALLAALGPGRVEHQRLRRHAVGVDAAEQRHLRVRAGGQLRGQPPAEQCGKRGRVAARALELEVGRRSGLGHPVSISGTCSSCQRPFHANWVLRQTMNCDSLLEWKHPGDPTPPATRPTTSSTTRR